MKAVGGNVNQAIDGQSEIDKLRQKIGIGFTDTPTARQPKKKMGKDDFLKIMSVQLQNQDPLSPLKNEELAAQLAQFSSLEQMVNVNKNLDKMTTEAKPRDNVHAASLIGKSIMMESSRVNLDEGRKVELRFELQDDVKSGKIEITDAKGEVVRSLMLDEMKKGKQSVTWNGIKESGLESPLGEYKFSVIAKQPTGARAKYSTNVQGIVTGVEFGKGSPMLIVGNNKVNMSAINRIELPGTGSSAAMPAASATNSQEAVKKIQANEKKAVQNADVAVPQKFKSQAPAKQLSTEKSIANQASSKQDQVAKGLSATGMDPAMIDMVMARLKNDSVSDLLPSSKQKNTTGKSVDSKVAAENSVARSSTKAAEQLQKLAKMTGGVNKNDLELNNDQNLINSEMAGMNLWSPDN